MLKPSLHGPRSGEYLLQIARIFRSNQAIDTVPGAGCTKSTSAPYRPSLKPGSSSSPFDAWHSKTATREDKTPPSLSFERVGYNVNGRQPPKIPFPSKWTQELLQKLVLKKASSNDFSVVPGLLREGYLQGISLDPVALGLAFLSLRGRNAWRIIQEASGEAILQLGLSKTLLDWYIRASRARDNEDIPEQLSLSNDNQLIRIIFRRNLSSALKKRDAARLRYLLDVVGRYEHLSDVGTRVLIHGAFDRFSLETSTWALVQRVVEEAISVRPTEHLLHWYAEACVALQQYHRLDTVLDKLGAVDIKPTFRKSFHVILETALRTQDVDRFLRAYEAMGAHGCAPDDTTESMMKEAFRCLAEGGSWAFIQEVTRAGMARVGPTASLLNWQARASLELGEYDMVDAVVEEFARTGIKPPRTTFHILLRVALEKADLARFFRTLEVMGDHGYPPDDSTLAHLNHTLNKPGKEWEWTFIQSLTLLGMERIGRSETLLFWHVKAVMELRTGRLHQLIDEVCMSRVYHTERLLDQLLQFALRKSDHIRAQNLFDLMKTYGYETSGKVKVLLAEYSPHTAIHDATAAIALPSFPSLSSSRKVYILNTLILAHLMLGSEETVAHLLASYFVPQMSELFNAVVWRNPNPDAPPNPVELFPQQLPEPLLPDTVLFGNLINYCASSQANFDGALQLLDGMLVLELELRIPMMVRLITACFKNNQAGLGIEIVARICESEATPLNLFEELHPQGFSKRVGINWHVPDLRGAVVPSVRLLCMLLEGIWFQEGIDVSEKVLRIMELHGLQQDEEFRVTVARMRSGVGGHLWLTKDAIADT
ncbi:hypothetical protein DFP72DRAFT_904197 [Ephemerocybe angulata]|uniref:Pentatricopeptide repeat-containing protein n=1 Tax=Ephemerocybe angulata TaxID=980116 RepID=A0A8H6M5Y6_9AGAR|nr:hypothetical protein DFP72DRAFT_904197 [Tulosesus angulatus]